MSLWAGLMANTSTGNKIRATALLTDNDLVLIEVLTLPVYGSVVSHAQSNRQNAAKPVFAVGAT